jgi:hypothetical protein
MVTVRNTFVTDTLRFGPYPVACMRARLVLVVLGLSLLFVAADLGAQAASQATPGASERTSLEVSASPQTRVAAPVLSIVARVRRLATVGLSAIAVALLALWLSWPATTRPFHARRLFARFSIRRRGPPVFLAAV